MSQCRVPERVRSGRHREPGRDSLSRLRRADQSCGSRFRAGRGEARAPRGHAPRPARQAGSTCLRIWPSRRLPIRSTRRFRRSKRFRSCIPAKTLVKSYQIRVRRPKFPWLPRRADSRSGGDLFRASPSSPRAGARSVHGDFRSSGLIFLLVGMVIVAGFFLFRLRGHTFLYLTNQRVIVLELTQGTIRARAGRLPFQSRRHLRIPVHGPARTEKTVWSCCC